LLDTLKCLQILKKSNVDEPLRLYLTGTARALILILTLLELPEL